MPHNRTRIWVGVAIAAVTIPAVGTFYYGSSTHDLRGTAISAAGRWDASSQPADAVGARPIVVHRVARDYQAEVDAALARQGTTTAPEPLVGSDDDPNFDVDPIGDDGTYVEPTPDTPPDLTTDLAPSVTTTVASATADEDVLPPEAATNVASTGILSDGDVYRIVTGNLSADDREEFVRAYSAMTPDQRADLLAGFREQMQSGDGR